MQRRIFLSLAAVIALGGIARAWAWVPEDVPGLHYPRAAQLARLEGVVVVECAIADDGTVKSARVKSGHPVLGRAAANSAKAWRFKRSGSNDKASTVQLTFEFRLVGTCKTQCCEDKFLLRYPDHVFVTSQLPTLEPMERSR